MEAAVQDVRVVEEECDFVISKKKYEKPARHTTDSGRDKKKKKSYENHI